MLKRHVFSRFIFYSALVAVMSSCVGTIEETPSSAPTVDGSEDRVAFGGVTSCIPIGPNKVDVYFGQATVDGLNQQENIVYQVFQDGNMDEAVATSIGSEIPTDENGNYHLVVKDIPKGTGVSFTVRAFDSVSGMSDDNYISCLAETLDEDIPDFDGVNKVEVADGIEGRSTLVLNWAKATPGRLIGSSIPYATYAIEGYKIYMGKEPGDLKLFTSVIVSESSHPTSYTVSGLNPGLTYYFKINAYDEGDRTDYNNKVLSAATNTPGAIKFNGAKEVLTPSGDIGYSTLTVTWDKASGDYNAYQIFSRSEDDPDFNNPQVLLTDTDALVGEVRDLSQTSFTIPGLSKDKRYAVYVVACESEAGLCRTNTTQPKGDSVRKEGITTPKLADFQGILSETILSGSAGLSSTQLNWNPPTNGVCDEIELIQSAGGNPSLVGEVLPTCPPPLGKEDLPCLSEAATCDSVNTIIANLETDQIYKFKAIVRAGAAAQEYADAREETVKLEYDKPDFDGITNSNCSAEGSTQIKCTWDAASGGLFGNYKIVWALQSDLAGLAPTEIPWNDSGDARFSYEILSKDTLEYTINRLSPGVQYRVYVRPYLKVDGKDNFEVDTISTAKITTPGIELKSGGLRRVVALGPSDAKAAFFESISINSFGTVQVSTASTKQDETYGAYGTVYLEWNEPTLSDGSRLRDMINTLGGFQNAQDGFHVYRKIAPVTISGGNETDVLNAGGFPTAVVGGNPLTGNWIKLTSEGIKPSPATGVSFFNDVDFEGLSLAEKEGKLVYYAILFEFGGNVLNYVQNEADDMLFDVLIPPTGMALQHRMMANKKMCALLGKSSDPREYYRCAYGGMGSKYIDGASYYDTLGHVLVDKINLNCNTEAQPITGSYAGTTGYSNTGECVVYRNVDIVDDASAVDFSAANWRYGGPRLLESHAYWSSISGTYKYDIQYHLTSPAFAEMAGGSPLPAMALNDYIIIDYDGGERNIPLPADNRFCGYFYDNFKYVPYGCNHITKSIYNDLIGHPGYFNSGNGFTYPINTEKFLDWLDDGSTNTFEVLNGGLYKPYFWGDSPSFQMEFKGNYNFSSKPLASITKDDFNTGTRCSYFSGCTSLYATPLMNNNFLYDAAKYGKTGARNADAVFDDGRGFDDGKILHKDFNVFPSPVANEFLGRDYASNTAELIGLGNRISSNVENYVANKIYTVREAYFFDNGWGSALLAPAALTCGVTTITVQDLHDEYAGTVDHPLLDNVVIIPASATILNPADNSDPDNAWYDSSGYIRADCHGYEVKSIADQPIKDIPASTANYMCESHTVEINGDIIRKRLLSAREAVMSSSSITVDAVAQAGAVYDDYGSRSLSTPVYLAGQALCDPDDNICTTNPDGTLIAKYQAGEYGITAPQFPFFSPDPITMTRFPDQDMYLRQDSNGGWNGTFFTWKLFGDYNGTADPIDTDNQFGLPLYINKYDGNSVSENAGKHVTNLPLSNFNPNFVLGQPLWCEFDTNGACAMGDDDRSFNDVLTKVAAEKSQHIQMKVRNDAANVFSSGQAYPFVPHFNPSGHTFMQMDHMIHDYEDAEITPDSLAYIHGVQWERLEETPSKDIQIRCAVKMEFDASGNLIKVDGLSK